MDRVVLPPSDTPMESLVPKSGGPRRPRLTLRDSILSTRGSTGETGNGILVTAAWTSHKHPTKTAELREFRYSLW